VAGFVLVLVLVLVIDLKPTRHEKTESFSEIEMAIGDFARRAQENKLKVEELQGGTFTIRNGGVYGSLLSTPIVIPPKRRARHARSSGVAGRARRQRRHPIDDASGCDLRPSHRRWARSSLISQAHQRTNRSPTRMLMEI
jgi:hypothetical protein